MTQSRTPLSFLPDRRDLLFAVPSAAAAFAVIRPARTFATPEMVRIENFDASGKDLGIVTVPKIVKTDAEWQAFLKNDEQLAYLVTRHAYTERPYSGKYWNNHDDGLYRCICCNTALFDSETKFNSETGWPSFYRAISDLNVTKSRDTSFMMERTAISCTRCDAHLGHLFTDGPNPTGLRYCMNSAALRFVKRAVA